LLVDLLLVRSEIQYFSLPVGAIYVVVTEPTSAPSAEPKKLTPDVDIPVRPPRTGVSTVSGVRGLGVEEVLVLEVRIRVATRMRGAGGG